MEATPQTRFAETGFVPQRTKQAVVSTKHDGNGTSGSEEGPRKPGGTAHAAGQAPGGRSGAGAPPGAMRARAALAACAAFGLLGAAGATYTPAHACEDTLAQMTLPDSSYQVVATGTTAQSATVGATSATQTSTTTVVRRYNTTEIDLALAYFMADLKATDNTGAHTQAHAAYFCGVEGSTSMPWSLGTLKSVVIDTIAACNYVVGTNGTHLYTALFRIETECSRNTQDQFCLLPPGFLRSTDGPWSRTQTTVEASGPFTVTTEVVTTYDYEFTYGGSALVHGICPNINTTDIDKPVPPANCCNRYFCLRACRTNTRATKGTRRWGARIARITNVCLALPPSLSFLRSCRMPQSFIRRSVQVPQLGAQAVLRRAQGDRVDVHLRFAIHGRDL